MVTTTRGIFILKYNQPTAEFLLEGITKIKTLFVSFHLIYSVGTFPDNVDVTELYSNYISY